MLILISGPPGCGKSTLARGVAEKINAVVLDKDQIDEPFSPNDRGESYTKSIEPKVLGALLRLAKDNLAIGHTVLLDAPWTHILIHSPEWQIKIKELTPTRKPLILECTLDEKRLRERIASRGLARDQVKLSEQGWANFLQTDLPHRRNPLPHVEIDMSAPAETCLKEALCKINLEK